jgi:hypothetical protein
MRVQAVAAAERGSDVAVCKKFTLPKNATITVSFEQGYFDGVSIACHCLHRLPGWLVSAWIKQLSSKNRRAPAAAARAPAPPGRCRDRG